MEWKKLAGDTGPAAVNWGTRLHSARPIDPYLIWADLTDFRWLILERPESGEAAMVPFLLELAGDPATFDWPNEHLPPGFPQIPPVYAAHEDAPRFYTGRVPVTGIRALLENARFSQVQLGLPRGTPVPSFKVINQGGVQQDNQTFVGIIDDGCAFVHPRLRSAAGALRVIALWDQDDGPRRVGKYWKAQTALGYGAEIDFIEVDKAGLPAGDVACYRQIGYQALLNKRRTHGAGVTDLAAGWPPPRVRNTPDRTPGARDYAGAAKVLFVQLPADTIADTSGGSLGVHVLDGLHYIVYRAERHEVVGMPDRTRRVVLNISFGALAGPHDGTSMTERALADFAATRGLLDIVFAAGNSRKSRAHMEVAFNGGPASQTLQWSVPPDNPQQSFLEAWLPDPVSAFTVAASAPGVAAVALHPGEVALLRDAAGNVVAGLFVAAKVVQGQRGTLALLAVGPTRTRTRPFAQSGIWRLEIGYQGSASPVVQVWSERNDLVVGLRRRQQSFLLPDAHHKASEQATQSSLASGGGWVATATQLLTRKDADYSADVRIPGAGPIPVVSAPVDLSAGRRGIRVAGVAGGAVARISGTSAAAPRVVRALVNDATRVGTVLSGTGHCELGDDLEIVP